MVFASIREHAEHCDFFASTSRNKKFALRANRAKVKFCEQLQILMDHSSPLQMFGILSFCYRESINNRSNNNFFGEIK